MQILGILVRTRAPGSTESWFPYADQILRTSREHGHIFIDLAADMATRENLVRLMDGIGSPSGALWKLVVFYCVGNKDSPLDQNGEEFVTNELIARFAGWGVLCIGCDVGKSLGRRLLEAGAHFTIAFNGTAAFAVGHAAEFFAGLNSSILRMLKEGISPSAATADMRQFFLQASDSAISAKAGGDRYGWVHALTMFWNAHHLEYYGNSLHKALLSIKPGSRQATEYHQIVADTLRDVLTPHLERPLVEVHGQSEISRFDIVFENRADRGFWHDIKMLHHNSIVIFDAKNKNRLKPSDVDQMLRYSDDSRGSVMFIVSRTRPSKNLRARIEYLVRKRLWLGTAMPT